MEIGVCFDKEEQATDNLKDSEPSDDLQDELNRALSKINLSPKLEKAQMESIKI